MKRFAALRRLGGPGGLVLLLLIALGAMAVGYALWFKVLTVNSVVQTGKVHAEFVKAFTDDDDVVDNPLKDLGDSGDCPDVGGVDLDGDGRTSCDPAASEDGIPDCKRVPGGCEPVPGQPEPRYDKDVARCDASVDPEDKNVARITKRNVYPSYYCTAWFEIHNDGTIPVRIASVTVNGKHVQPSVPTPFDLTGDGVADLEIHITEVELCHQIDPSETVDMDVDQHVLQGAPEGTNLTYTVQLQLNQWNEPCPPPQPVFEVVATGFTADGAVALATALGIPSDNLLAPDGSIRFVDPERFQAVPVKPAEFLDAEEDGQETVAEAFDLAALADMPVYDEQAALARAVEALATITQTDGATASVDHTMFEATDGQEMVHALLDTQVNLNFALNGLPLVGPGAKGKVGFDGGGEVSIVMAAGRELREGPSVKVMPPGEAEAQCADAFGTVDVELVQLSLVSPRLVYFAPPLEMDSAARIYPHYECGGTAMVGGEEILLRNVYVPAIEDAPKVDLAVDVDGSFVSADAAVSGGTPPYSFQWSSSNVGELPANKSSVDYNVSSREVVEVIDETVCVAVTDADGLMATECQTVEVFPDFLNNLNHESVEAGTEWIGTCGGLPGSSGNAGGFVSTMQNEGIAVDFNWGNASAWERDFKDPAKGGDDSNWVDEVDAVFYTGHANGNGLGNFCSSVDDTFVHYTDALWGNLDLEWLVTAACGPLQATSGGKAWWERWGPAFKGLHLLMGYANVSQDNTTEGRDYAKAMLGRGFPWNLIGPQKVRIAWAFAAISSQSSSVIYSYMGAMGPGGVTNYNDYFWGKGPVGPDIANPTGYWIVWSPS